MGTDDTVQDELREICEKLAYCLAVADRHRDFVLAAVLCDAHEAALSRMTGMSDALGKLSD